MPLAGEVVFQRVTDLGGTLDMKKARSILGAMAEVSAVQASKRAAPEYISYAKPIPLNLSELNLELSAEDGSPAVIQARLYEVGALGLSLRIQMKGEKIQDLSRYHTMQVRCRGQLMRKSQLFALVADAIRPRLKDAYDEVFNVPVEDESYAAYCLTEVPGGAEHASKNERAAIAGLLINDSNPEKLSPSAIEDTLRNAFSYYRDDMVIADWDAAFIVEPNAHYEDILYICEVANLQLLALRKYDIYLDNTLEQGYDDYEGLVKGPPISTGRARSMVSELGVVRMELAEVTDEIANTAKFFGDWYVARIYMGLSQKLHINDYRSIVEEKLRTLNELYESVLAEIDRRQNIILEFLIVLLIVFEVVMAFVRPH